MTIILATLLLASFLAQLTALQVEECDEISDEDIYRSTIIRAVCDFDQTSSTASAFRNETRLYHNETEKTDGSDTYGVIFPFSDRESVLECGKVCEDTSRENVKWCVRIAHPNKTIETCISLNDKQEPVYESTCDAIPLQLQKHLSLPTDCQIYRDGCLGFLNVDWVFKDIYVTCIAKTDTCSDVSFVRPFILPSVNTPPKIEHITTSPLKVQPSEQIILRSLTISTTPNAFIIWHHGNATYKEHIREDPFCEEDCRADVHTDAHSLRTQRIRSYFKSLTVVESKCLGTGVESLLSYLIIDNATASDAGMYTVNVTTQEIKVFNDIADVNVTVECEQSLLYKVSCTNTIIVMEWGKNTEWDCELNAPPDSNISVVLNKTTPLLSTNLTGIYDLDKFCDKTPRTLYHVVEDPQHVCYSNYRIHVVVCATSEDVVGDYTVVYSQENAREESRVSLKVKAQPLPRSDDSSDERITPAAYVVPVVVLVIALVGIGIILVVLIRRRKRKRARGHLSQLQSPDPTSPEAAFYKKRLESGQFSPVSLMSPPAGNVTHSDPLEFPRNRLYVYSKKVLGEGSFGRVLQAKAEGIVPGMPERNIVAIKTTKENATSIEIEELLAELHLMKNMEPHENILNLLGQCTTPGGPVCLIVEFARYGNLRDFLRQCEEVVLSLNHKPHIPRNRSRTGTFSSSSISSTQPLMLRQDSSVFTPGSGGQHQFVFPFPSPPSLNRRDTSSSSTGDSSRQAAHHPNTAVPLAHSVTPIGHDYINTKGLVYMEDVHNFALQIACGLQHIASMQIVHCDLAARNVLIAEGFVLKIADFGLARDISGREMYKKNPRGKIPVKWTAPEALENRVFTTKSDVWSYGVVLWELFTYGHTPYPDVHLSQSYESIIAYLKEGNRMAQPESCSDSFYELMQKCWNFDPDQRPTPVDIVASLTPLDGACQHDSPNTCEADKEDFKSNGIKANGNHHNND